MEISCFCMKLILLLLPIFFALVVSVYLFVVKNKNRLSSKILGVFFLLLCLALFTILFQYIQEFYPFLRDYFYLVEIPFYFIMLCLPVVVYFYVLSLSETNLSYRNSSFVLPHFFIPLQSLLFNMFPFVVESNPSEIRAAGFLDYYNFFSLKVVFVLLNIYYLIRTLFIYKRHKEHIENVLSFEVGISLRWLLFFLSGYVSFIACFFILNPDSSPYVVYLPMVLLLIYFYFQRDIPKADSIENYNLIPSTDSNSIEIEKQHQPLSDAKTETLKQQLLEYISNEKVYLRKDLTLYDVANSLNTNSTYVSYVLNNSLKSNFVSFINSYRIEEAKKVLLDKEYDNYTIEAISELVGFNSKSAFNTAFKTRVGVTPSTFKRNSAKA